MSDATLVHELVHVWQYQKNGGAYISDSLWHQSKALLTEGSRGGAYDVTLVPGRSIHEYTAEQQAVIVEWAFADPAGFGRSTEVVRLLAEIYEPSS
jgi:hypothetical protein